MSTLANETIFETLFDETLEEMGINKDSLFYADACKIAEQMAMDRLLSYYSIHFIKSFYYVKFNS